jgi:dTDP-4-amino-4,6-dideoxygalactose transaminase
VGPGDEVVTSPLSATFTALAAMAIGARPVFADLDPRTLNLDPVAAEKGRSPRTKALLPVHLYGHPADMDPFLDLSRRLGIPLLEDACQAHGALYKGRTVGTVAGETGLGALSFYPTKNLGALGDGGALVVNDPSQAQALRRLRNGGQSDRYRHEIFGLNSRLDEMQAAILRVGLSHLAKATERRRQIAATYLQSLADLPGLALPREQPYARAVFHLFPVRHARRDALAAALRTRGIGTLIHYPIPLHLQPALKSLGCREGEFPLAEQAAREVLSLPLYPELTDAQATLVGEAVKDSVLALS